MSLFGVTLISLFVSTGNDYDLKNTTFAWIKKREKQNRQVVYDSCQDCKFLSLRAFSPPVQRASTQAASCVAAVKTFPPQRHVALGASILFPISSVCKRKCS